MTGWSFGSQIYGSAWSTPALRALFDDLPRTRRWLEILATLAEVQGEFAVIPAANATAVAKACRAVVLDESFFADVRAGYETTGHSTAGLIQALRRRSPEAGGERFHFGATVQDVTDSWLMLALDEAREDKTGAGTVELVEAAATGVSLGLALAANGLALRSVMASALD